MSDRLTMPRSTVSAAILAQLATEYGMTPAQCLDRTGITPAALTDPNAEIQTRQELQLVHNLITRLGHVPGLGLRAGQRYHLAVNGIWAFAVITSPTVRRAWRIGIDYMDIGYSPGRWRLEEQATEASAVIDYRGLPEPTRTFLLERDLAGIFTLNREVFGRVIPPSRVELACPRPGYAQMFTELLGYTPLFDAPITRIAMTNELLDIPMPQADPRAAALAEQQCAAIMQRRRERQGTGAKVRAALLSHGVATGQDDIATALRMSTRTLRRRLDDEGTSYRELLDETRQALAEELLGIGATVEDVAERLGYADASSFTHAFIRWTGNTPGRYARAAR